MSAGSDNVKASVIKIDVFDLLCPGCFYVSTSVVFQVDSRCVLLMQKCKIGFYLFRVRGLGIILVNIFSCLFFGLLLNVYL